ncbi:uncharacterized protein I206_105205 [Kwoniella pini CBS 10737]|uniref:RING-14 protein n=1 Tax=Kwoniella pini CBS 10737 TaxID=1296096 RepID=A0A1B9I503_9TREE|nr:uncharacterized protein I206_03886 [Kwoniella pini CBS 10737]OCF50561.1 hypothetical protein I206_03886 [Kwoniella pini CBS 10737]
MKYGKEFQHILEDSSFPPEWKDSAIEYRRLKKLIKNVVHELTSMGLSPNVLNKLLVTEDHNHVSSTKSDQKIQDMTSSRLEEDDEVLEFEYESPETTPPTIQSGSNPTLTSQTHELQPQEVIIDPLPSSPPLKAPHPSSSSSVNNILSPEPHHSHKKFRLRLLSDTPSELPTISLDDLPKRPMSVGQFLEAQEKLREEKTPSPANEHRGRRVVRRAVLDGTGGVKAEYVLTGDPSNPIPQLRLHVQASPAPSHEFLTASASPSLSPSPAWSTPDDDTDQDTEDENDDITPFNVDNNTTPRPLDRLKSPILPSSPTLQKMKSALSPIFAIASGRDIRGGMRDLTIGDSIVDENSSPTTPKAKEFPFPKPRSITTDMTSLPEIPSSTEDLPEISTSTSPSHERDFIIPLSSDLEFFHLLTSALTSLSTFHSKQQVLFKQAVENVCGTISSTISPSSGSAAPQIVPIPPTTSPLDVSSIDAGPSVVSKYHSGKTSKKDLYIWREIFTLWIESEIFESTSERTRGERTLEEAENRLKIFANEVVKRGLGDRRTLKGKKTRNAWEEFLKLNVWLLDLKRFQGANVMAARKILKKHDKRTALTASEGFPSFVKSTLSTYVDKDGNVSTWAFYNTSLPHILLASLTNTLLPILPSLDDYSCLICTSIAFKPIRLGCGHLFCVRCLVKMQRSGKEECPLCRGKVVLLADKNSLDLTVMNFMKSWFPKEVKLKQKENELEVAKEHAKEAGIDTRCIIM